VNAVNDRFGPVRRDRDFGDFTFRTLHSAELAAGDIDAIMQLFEINYREANRAYLEKSLLKLKYATIAMHGGVPAAFALGEARIMDLPRLPKQFVALAGICCVAPQFRRRGLFGEVEMRSMAGAGIRPPERYLSCGRMAHPASFHLMSRNPAVVPRPGVTPSEWHQAVGIAIAEAYGVAEFDPLTFVCKGTGVPIGYPVMEVDATPEEWEMFRYVDRSRGDSLLGIAWWPDAPEGW
jgi:hypothetical protein